MPTEERRKTGRPSRLWKLRKELDLDRQTASEGIGCAASTLHLYENNTVRPSKNFKAKAIEFYSKTLGRPLTEGEIFGRWG